MYNMEIIKPFLEKIADTPVFLNNGEFGWYLNHGGKLYSVPESFQSKILISNLQKTLLIGKKHTLPHQSHQLLNN